MSATTITVQFSNGPRAVDAIKLRELVDTGRVTGASRVASLDGGATWVSVDQALAAASGATAAPSSVSATSVPAESIPDAVLGESWASGADPGDAPYSDGVERIPTRVVAGFLELSRSKLTSSFFLCGHGLAMKAGNWAIIIAAVWGIIIAGVHASEAKAFRVFLEGAILPVLLLIAQYAANRATGAGERILAATRCSVRSRAVLDIVALAALVGGLGAFAAGIALTVDARSHEGVLYGLVSLIISWHVAALCFAPGLTTTRVDHTVSAWKEAVGVLGFLGKSALRMAPVFFGFLSVLYTWLLVYGTWDIMQKDSQTTPFFLTGSAMLGLLLLLALLPFICFIAFTVWYHLLALVESVFHIERQAAPKAQA